MARPRSRGRITDPFNPEWIQGDLFPVEKSISSPFPFIERTYDGFIRVLSQTNNGVGLDLEYIDNRPTIIGIASDTEAAALTWEESLGRTVLEHARETNQPIVAFAGMGADRPVLEQALGESTPLEMWEDPMVSHYLTHMGLCKAPAKEEDSDDTGALGMMNLWTAASFATTVPQWKECRGPLCEGPCPRHDVWGYCAVDAWAGLMVHRHCLRLMEEMSIPFQLYRERVELASICVEMQQRGIRVDLSHVAQLEREAGKVKDGLFPFETVGKKKVYTEFNPNAPQQVIDWFRSKGILLKTAGKKDVEQELKKQARRFGCMDIRELEKREDPLPEEVEYLYRLWQYKEAGKGLKAWFDLRWVTTEKEDI